MRRKPRTDGNHQEVRKALRDAAIQVLDLSGVGSGCPDLLAYCALGRGALLLLEVKDGSKPPSARRLTADEAEFHARWEGAVAVVTSADEAVDAVLRACGVMPGRVSCARERTD